MRRARELSVPAPTMSALYGLVGNADRVRRGLQRTFRPADLAQSPTVV
jgi:hypothetical protein